MIRFLLLLLALPAYALEPVKWPNPAVAWANTAWPHPTDTTGNPNLQPGRWNTIDVSQWVPADAKAALLHGILIITHGNAAPAHCNIVMWWRLPGQDGTAGAYVSQAVATELGGGVRHPDAILVPVQNQRIELWYDATPGAPAYPAGCAYGFTYRLQAIVR
jgi:hypothetical protein